MTPLLKEFLAETREALENIGSILIDLEKIPNNNSLIEELFRLVHTLKGASGIFNFPEMTRVLHAGEDLMSLMRQGKITYGKTIANRLLESMDFIATICVEIEEDGEIGPLHVEDSVALADQMRAIMNEAGIELPRPTTDLSKNLGEVNSARITLGPEIYGTAPQELQSQWIARISKGDRLHVVQYTPVEDCFFSGEDPFYTARLTPGCLWGSIDQRDPWPQLQQLDAYRCNLKFSIITDAPKNELLEHFRYVAEQIQIFELESGSNAGVAITSTLQNDQAHSALSDILAIQRQVLVLEDKPAWYRGRLEASANTLMNCAKAQGDTILAAQIAQALETSFEAGEATALLHVLDPWLVRIQNECIPIALALETPVADGAVQPVALEEGSRFGRRSDDHSAHRVLKVDQEKVDRLMNLIGEMIVSKNALPYLAQKAENQYGIRELSREIKSQYAVINRIVEEMQDAILQVRMMPVSVVFQRFPRLVRDISNKLGKQVSLSLEGEETEADKNIIESLVDPLIHIVRNSLDHGLETPEERVKNGKSATGTLVLRASQDADRVLIEIIDDGKGIDPEVVKRMAYQKGLINEEKLASISDEDAIQLVFAPGFSTAEVVSDLSGRGVGMDAVRNAVDRVNGTLHLESKVGKGTEIRISLPLSMAVTKVMIIESDGQIFGVPMDVVVETVRIHRDAIHTIKQSPATVLRGQLIPLKPLNELLAIPAKPRNNADDELAVLVIRLSSGIVGLVVDGFREAIDVIQKPLVSVLSGLNTYSGSAVMGDGTVLMVLNVKELF